MPSTIFNGTKVKVLKSTLNLNGGADIINSATDPTSSAVSADPGSLLLNSSTGKLYRKNDSGSSTNWSEVGSGGSGINYITNPSASTNTTGWNTYADAAGSQPVDGAGGVPNVTWTRSTAITTITPLRGSADFEFSKDAVNRQGQGAVTDFVIDFADQAKVLTVTFDYVLFSGTYSTGDLAIYLIADPTGTPIVIQPAGYQVQAATSGTKMKHIATFQTQATGQNYRLCFHVASTSASAYVIHIDNVVVGPQVVQYGAPVTDWVAYTPTVTHSSGTATNLNVSGFYYRRVGDQLQVTGRAKFTGAAGTWAAMRFSIPSGLLIDSAKLDTTDSDTPVGTATFLKSMVQAYTGLVIVSTGTVVSMRGIDTSTTYGNYYTPTQAVPFAWGNTDSFSLNFTVPIVGWSSTVQMSNDTDTRVVGAFYNTANATPVSGTLAAGTAVVAFTNKKTDSSASYNTSTGEYTVPVSGYYDLSAQLRIQTTFTAANQNMGIYFAIDGSTETRSYITSQANIASNCVFYPQASLKSFPLNAGQKITLIAKSDGTSPAIGTNATDGWFSVSRVSGPSAIAASEFVGCKYTSAAGNSVTNAAYNYIDFPTKVFDTHGIVSGTGSGNVTVSNTGWKATIPVSGRYLICAHSLSASGGGWAAGEEWTIGIRQNNSIKAESPTLSQATHTTSVFSGVSTTIDAVAGDFIEITIYQGSGASLAMSTSSARNQVSIIKVG